MFRKECFKCQAKIPDNPKYVESKFRPPSKNNDHFNKNGGGGDRDKKFGGGGRN